MDLNKVLNNLGFTSEEAEKESNNKTSVNNSNNSSNLDLLGIDDVCGLCSIKIVGVGGAGNNIVNFLSTTRNWPKNCQLWGINTDVKPLRNYQNNINVLLIGKKILNGYGTGGDPKYGSEAFLEDVELVKEKIIKGTDILFVLCGLGKGTGSGASPELVKLAKENNVTCVTIATLPSLKVEGRKVYDIAIESSNNLIKHTSSISLISNDKIILANKSGSFIKELENGNKEFAKIMSSIIEIIDGDGYMNIDFNDIKSFFANNKFFVHLLINSVDINDTNKINEKIKDELRNSYCNINFNNLSTNSLVNFVINTEASNNVLSSVRNTLEEIIGSNDINMIYGMEIKPDCSISIFLSNNEQHLDNSANSTTLKTKNTPHFIKEENNEEKKYIEKDEITFDPFSN